MTYGIPTRRNGEGDGTGVGQTRTPPPPAPPRSGTPAPTVTAPPTPILPLTTQLIADVLKGGDFSTADSSTIRRFLSACISVATNLNVAWNTVAGGTVQSSINSVRSAVVNAFMRASEVSVDATAHGFLLPNDPMPRFSEINRDRRLFDGLGISNAESDDLLRSSIDLIKVAIAVDAGKINFLEHRPAAQLASFEVSLDGIVRQTGDPLVDILGYQPDADFIKRKQALESLSKLDFSKRKPYLLFTADVISAGKRSETIICWIKMRDASGYTISKRDVFSGIDFQPSTITAQQAQVMTQRLLADPDFRQVLSFYDWVQVDDIVGIIDQSSQPGTLYSYSVSGVQNRAPLNNSPFDTSLNSLYLSPAQAEMVRRLIAADASSLSSTDDDSVSPYPALAQVVLGDSGYGWILAGCNMFGSKRRGDSDDETRSFSYIGSKASQILSAAAAGRLFIPTDLNSVHSAIDSGISSYGVSQTILSVLDGTGVTLFASKKDDPGGFQPTQQSLESVSRGLAKILSAIDPGSATIDPHTLAVNLSTHTSSGQQPRYSSTSLTSSGVQVPDVGTLDAVFGTGVIDLTTYSGISRLMQIIRTIYDFYPGALS